VTRARPVVLVVEAEPGRAAPLVEYLGRHDFQVEVARDAESAGNLIERRGVQCLVAPLKTRRVDGIAVLRRLLRGNPEACGVLVADHENVEAAVTAMREGAYDVLVAPVHPERLLAILQRGVAHQALAARVAEMERQLDERLGVERLTGSSRAIHRVIEQIRAVATTRASVLVEGEPGTGKRLVAQTIHRNSPRRDERFVWVSCAVPGEVLEGELFGYERGTTGVGVVQPGRFELADGGTLFLGDVGQASSAVQARLLRAIQERSVERVGGDRTQHADVRWIASTSEDLEEQARAGRFRADLFERLSVVRVRMPALRERAEDIPLLVEEFIRDFDREHGRKVTGIAPGAMEWIVRHPWPGNVRELKNVVEGMVVATDERRRLDLSDLPASLRGRRGRAFALAVSIGMTVEEAERQLIEATLRHTQGDKPRAAGLLGIGLRTLYRKIERYGIG
jgi:DNA-binding NtrC family response regulator